MKQPKGKIMHVRGHMKPSSFSSQEGDQIISTRQNGIDRKSLKYDFYEEIKRELCVEIMRKFMEQICA